MRKTILLAFAVIFSAIGIQAQNFVPTYTGIINHTNDYLTINPFNSSYDDGSYAKIFYDGDNKLINFWNSDVSTDYTNIRVGEIISSSNAAIGTSDTSSARFTIQQKHQNDHFSGIRLVNYWNNQSSYFYMDGSNRMNFENGVSATRDFIFNGNGTGKVGIGTKNPDEMLTVKGKIHSEEVRVDLNVPADYVFQKYFLGYSDLKSDYTMPSLEEVETFIEENHHLSGIPSADEIIKDGLHLKEMTNLLLQKIEELTLYTIEQEKRIKALEVQLQEK